MKQRVKLHRQEREREGRREGKRQRHTQKKTKKQTETETKRRGNWDLGYKSLKDHLH